jgi:hypothetical protein
MMPACIPPHHKVLSFHTRASVMSSGSRALQATSSPSTPTPAACLGRPAVPLPSLFVIHVWPSLLAPERLLAKRGHGHVFLWPSSVTSVTPSSSAPSDRLFRRPRPCLISCPSIRLTQHHPGEIPAGILLSIVVSAQNHDRRRTFLVSCM